MSLFHYLRRKRSLLAEVETLRAENAQLRYNLTTAWLASWIKHPGPLPRRRSEPHPVRPGRHQAPEVLTELHPRISRGGPLK